MQTLKVSSVMLTKVRNELFCFASSILTLYTSFFNDTVMRSIRHERRILGRKPPIINIKDWFFEKLWDDEYYGEVYLKIIIFTNTQGIYRQNIGNKQDMNRFYRAYNVSGTSKSDAVFVIHYQLRLIYKTLLTLLGLIFLHSRMYKSTW